MNNKYESVNYSDEDKIILDNTKLTSEELQKIKNLRNKFIDKNFSTAIEAMYKFYKNDYSPSDLAEVYQVSTRQIQRIFKELGINRDKTEAQQIAVSKRNYTEIRKDYKKTVLERLTDTELNKNTLDEYLRHQIDVLLFENIPGAEIIVGISSININNNESDIPIIIIHKTSLYKYIITVVNEETKDTSGRKRDKNTKAYYKGYTLFKLNTKSYFNSLEDPEKRYEKEIKSKLLEIIDIVTSEVIFNTSTLKLE